MIVKFKSLCILELEHIPGKEEARHLSTKFNLDVSDNLDKSKYLKEDNTPTKTGMMALTNNFVQGLIGNIHNAHNNEQWDSAEHLRYIIAQLEKGFINVTDVDTSKF